MSLAGVKVGEEVVVTDVNRQEPQRTTVTKVGRIYISTRLGSFHIENGEWQNRCYSSHRRAYTIAAWEREQAKERLRALAHKVADAGLRLGMLSDEQIRETTTALEKAVETMGGA